ncbi:MAG: hypothetical protein HY266_03365 [Deltaproteobacteria bacterium]|nr:hypothetical protein [Deltaproteobacteria bacterium]
MKKKPLTFYERMDILDTFSCKGKHVRANAAAKPAAVQTVSAGIREAIRLSEQLIWKKPSGR